MRLRSPILAIAGCMAAAMLMGAACSKMQDANPIAEGCTALEGAKVDKELCAYATYGSLNIFAGQAVAIADTFDQRARSTSDAAAAAKYIQGRDALLKVEERSKGVQDSLLAAVREVEKIRREVSETDGTREEQILKATASLDRWLSEAGPLLTDLINSVRGAKTT